jgi:hypothetical protein
LFEHASDYGQDMLSQQTMLIGALHVIIADVVAFNRCQTRALSLVWEMLCVIT